MINLNPQIVERLIDQYQFKPRGEHLREGICPQCSKKTLWTWLEKPGMVQCNRTNKCDWSASSKELFPDLFENLNKKYPASETNPNQTADVYLSLIRGFDTGKISGWYEQAKYWHPHADKGTATVRFYLDAQKTIIWERLIEDVVITAEDGSKETRNKNFKGSFKGLWWQPPGFQINDEDEIYLCEGILDAIALNLNGFKAVAIMSSGTFPHDALQPHLHKRVTWILALDNDVTGRRYLHKHAERLRKMDQRVQAALTSDNDHKKDWNDCHKENALTLKQMQHYRYLGNLEIAESALDKALLLWKMTKKSRFSFKYKKKTYSIKVDYDKFQKQFGEPIEEVPIYWIGAERTAFSAAVSGHFKQIGTFTRSRLYVENPSNGEPLRYTFKFEFDNHAPEKIMTFLGRDLSSATKYKEAIMQTTPSAIYTGSQLDLDDENIEESKQIPREVKLLDFVGYDAETQSYVYLDYAVQYGKLIKLNNESYFTLKNGGIKTAVDIKQKLNAECVTDWLQDYQTAFGIGGMVALSWWFGCLFVEQVRADYRSYPFLEVVGEAGSGKSDMVDFLWKLLGREGESFNPNSSTLAGRTRKMSEVANLPVVFNETDNEKLAEDRHQKMFNWDEQKDLFDGEFGRVTGVKSQDNSTKKPTFKAGLMIVQNIPVVASEAIMSRIMHLQFDRSHHSRDGKHASDRLNRLSVLDVSGFLLHSAQREPGVMAAFQKHFIRHRKTLQNNPNIKLQRIVENHAKIMAFADCLCAVLPIEHTTVNQIHAALISMAEIRQISLNEDHPIIQLFWEAVDAINSRAYNWDGTVDFEDDLNHSKQPDKTIAINLVSFAKKLADLELEHSFKIDWMQLKRHIPTSRKYKFIGNKPVDSRIDGKITRCWVFER